MQRAKQHPLRYGNRAGARVGEHHDAEPCLRGNNERRVVVIAVAALGPSIETDGPKPRLRDAVPPQAESPRVAMDRVEAAGGLILGHFSHRSGGKNTYRPDSSTAQEH